MEVAVLSSPSLLVLTVSVDVKQHRTCTVKLVRVQELCESGGGRPELPVPNKPTVSVDVRQH